MASVAEIQQIFADNGLAIRQSNKYTITTVDLIEAESVKKIAQIPTDDERIDFLSVLLGLDAENKDTVAGFAEAELTAIQDYLLSEGKSVLTSSYIELKDILQFTLVDEMDNAAPPQTVDGNVVAISSFTADSGNTGDGTVGSGTVNQLVRSQDLRLECINATVVGSELWTVVGEESGTLSTQATTGVTFLEPNTAAVRGGMGFLITVGGTDFIVGDIFFFNTTSDDGGVFQTYFRDNLDVVLPFDLAGAETILDSLAE